MLKLGGLLLNLRGEVVGLKRRSSDRNIVKIYPKNSISDRLTSSNPYKLTLVKTR